VKVPSLEIFPDNLDVQQVIRAKISKILRNLDQTRFLTGQLSILFTILNNDKCFSVFPRSSFNVFAISRNLSKESINN
jgi:hypothetical protein